ncbi:MAG: hypothetical protein J3K34DRAFT_526977 [Monoraphidium minutum]|nr:MAG: hypothetical protein J3K34DRAFT_526977 [Monoraphidium minutum]
MRYAKSIPRRRSGQPIVSRDQDFSDSEEEGDGRPPPRSSSGAPSGRLPLWQVLALSAAAVALLLLALRFTTPRGRAGPARRGGGRGGAPKCFALSDTDRVKLVGSQNAAAQRPVATGSEGAQVLFNLGLLQAWGFERVEAAVNFQAALRYDSRCAMCRWGLAYAAGPYPNVMTGPDGAQFPTFTPSAALDAEEHAAAAARMAVRAQQLGGRDEGLLQREVELTQLTAKRFKGASAAVGGDGRQWYEQEREYAEAMAALAEAHVNDADVFALAAEAFLNLRPWDYYTPLGNLRPEASRAEALLRRALALDSRHPLALHLHIHVAEAGAPTLDGAGGDAAVWAGRALGSAEALAALGAQQGHLMHMPSHIYVRAGLYKEAVDANKRAYNFDVTRSTLCVNPYLPEHNVNLLVYAASMAGQLHTAEAYARGVRDIRERVGDRWMASGSEWVSLPLVLARYGEWRKILKLEPPGPDARGVTTYGGTQFAEVVYRFARVLAMAARADAYTARALGVADAVAYDLAARGAEARRAEVVKEMKLLRSAVRVVPTEPPTRPGLGVGMYASDYPALARIYGALAGARAALALNETAHALDQLDEAVALDEGMGYMEPPRLHQPARQCLGHVLLRAGRLGEAANVFKKDLAQHPDNGWSLTGLAAVAAAEARAAGGSSAADEAAAAARAVAADSWKKGGAEVAVRSSCPSLAHAFVL